MIRKNRTSWNVKICLSEYFSGLRKQIFRYSIDFLIL